MSGNRSHFFGMGQSAEEPSHLGDFYTVKNREKTLVIISDETYFVREISAECRELGIFHIRLYSRAELNETRNFDRKIPSFVDDIVIIDLPHPSTTDIDLLIDIEIDAKKTGAQLIIATTIDGIDDVYGCLNGNSAQILVAPNHADRMIALGEALARCGNRVRELSGDDRVTLFRLSELVSQIAQRLDTVSGLANLDSVPAFSFAATPDALVNSASGDRPIRATRPALPDPRLVRKIIRNRQLRSNFFDGALFADPAWDMLLDLTAARAEHVRVTVSSLCIASNVPSSTALRWIRQLTEMGLVIREDDDDDRRRTFLTLSDGGALAMAKYFAELDVSKGRLI